MIAVERKKISLAQGSIVHEADVEATGLCTGSVEFSVRNFDFGAACCVEGNLTRLAAEPLVLTMIIAEWTVPASSTSGSFRKFRVTCAGDTSFTSLHTQATSWLGELSVRSNKTDRMSVNVASAKISSQAVQGFVAFTSHV